MKINKKLVVMVMVLGTMITMIGCSGELKAKDFANKENCTMKFENVQALAISDSEIKVSDNKIQREYLSGKGYTIEVYEKTKDAIILKHISYPDSKEVYELKGKDHFDREENTDEVILQGPIKAGTKFGNYEIVDINADPKLDVELEEGSCILVKGEKTEGDTKYKEEIYFKEGYGVVKSALYKDDILITENVLKYYEKK